MWVIATSGEWINIQAAARLLVERRDRTAVVTAFFRKGDDPAGRTSVDIISIPKGDDQEKKLEAAMRALKLAIESGKGICDIPTALATFEAYRVTPDPAEEPRPRAGIAFSPGPMMPARTSGPRKSG
jgi:hypothetical protein